MYFVLGIILGGAIITLVYESYYDKKDEKISKLLAPKLQALIEMSSLKIDKKRKKLKRELTEEEKNEILDDCYSEM